MLFHQLLFAALGVILIPVLTFLAVQALSHDPRPIRTRRSRS